MEALHTEDHSHGSYRVEHHGAGIHALLFKTKRQRKYRYIGTFNNFESAKNGIVHHVKTGWSKPCSIGSHINLNAKWIKKENA